MLEVFGASKKSLCCTCFCFLELHLEEQSGPAGRAEENHQAKALQDAAPSLLEVLQEPGGDSAVECETAEVWQLHKRCDNVSRLGGQFLMRPRNCNASSGQPISSAFGVLPPLPPPRERHLLRKLQRWFLQCIRDQLNETKMCMMQTSIFSVELQVAIWQSVADYSRLSLATCELQHFWFRHLELCLRAPPREQQSPWYARNK